MSGYWETWVTEIVPEIGVDLTPDQQKELIESVTQAHEMYGESNGFDVAGRNLVAQQDREEDRLKSEIEKLRWEMDFYKRHIAKSTGVSPRDVRVSDGRVKTY